MSQPLESAEAVHSEQNLASKCLEQDFVKVTKLLHPDDLRDFYHALSIPHRDIEVAEKDADSNDVDIRARAVLCKWRQKSKGREATRQAILDALEKCRFIEARENIEDIWSGREIDTKKDSDFYCILESLEIAHLQIVYQSLGLTSNEIARALKREQSNDVQQNARAVIQWWRKTNGKKATPEALTEIVQNSCRKVPFKAQSSHLFHFQEQLKAEYKANRSSIGFLPGLKKEFSLDEFFVDLRLVHEDKRPTEVTRKVLKEYTDLLTLKNRRGKILNHVLVRGEAGTGKSTLINQLAHQWATCSSEDIDGNKSQNPLSKFELVFALNIRFMETGMDLVDCIQNQLLHAPLASMSKDKITNILTDQADNCLFLLDGYDEMKSDQEYLSRILLYRSFVIVTTRPDKVDQFCQNYNGFVHVKLSGFSEESRKTFISKYFDSSSSTDSFLEKVKTTYLNPLSYFPLLLAMMCFIFDETGKIPLRMTALYKRALDVFATQYYAKASSFASLSEAQRKEIDDVLLSVGSTALDGLLIDDSKLIFNTDDFEAKNRSEQQISRNLPNALLHGVLPAIGFELGAWLDSEWLQLAFPVAGLLIGYALHRISRYAVSGDTIDMAKKLGVLTEVQSSRNQILESCQFSFLHKTFQEFAAAMYWSSLAVSDRARFEYYLNRIIKDNVESMQYLLRFCCGLNKHAAEIILKHVVGKCDVDWRLAVTLLFEAEEDSLHSSLHTILRPLKVNIRGETVEHWTILRHYVSYEQDADWLWLRGIEELSIDADTNNMKDCTQFLSNGIDLTSISRSIKSLSIKVTNQGVNMVKEHRNEEVSEFVTNMKRFLMCQEHVRHLTLVNNLKRSDELNNWKELSAYIHILVSNLESLVLVGMNNCEYIEETLDVFINAGKNVLRQNVASISTSQSSNIASPRNLPIRTFDISRSIVKPDMEPFEKKVNPPITSKQDFDFVKLMMHGEDDEPYNKALGKLKQALLYMPCLEYLGLAGNSMTSTCLRELTPAISRMSRLQILNLHDAHLKLNTSPVTRNNFKHSGGELSQILQSATDLRELVLAGIGVDEDDIRQLSLKKPSELTKIDLSNIGFGSQGLVHLSEMIQHTPKLRELNLAWNEACQQGVAAFQSSLCHIPQLTHLTMTVLDEESFILLAEGFRHISKLQYLALHLTSGGMLMISVETTEIFFRNLVCLPELNRLTFSNIAPKGNNYSQIVEACKEEFTQLQSEVYGSYLFGYNDINTIKRIVTTYA